jgi:hypothetical protein
VRLNPEIKKSQSEDNKLAYFKKKILEQLDKLEKPNPPPINKVFLMVCKGGKGLPVGSIREWKGKKYIKTPSGKWKPKYEAEGGRGIKMSLTAIRRAVDKAKSPHELMNIVLDNRDRFSDEHGNPLPIVQELSTYVSKRGDALTAMADRNAAREADRAKKREEAVQRIKNKDTPKPATTEPAEPQGKPKTVEPADVTDSKAPKIAEKYRSYTSVDGDEDDINVNGEEIQERWKLVEADAPSASHDEITFAKTEGFPESAAGTTVNDRDYEHDRAAQEMVVEIASKYDSRALSMDNPVVVTQDGVVISGNNRTMSSKVAARNGTDTGYIAALQRKAKKFGIDPAEIGNFKHPWLVFEVHHDGAYDTELFAKFNARDTKQMSPVETAVKMSKRMDDKTLRSIADELVQFDTLGELYADDKTTGKIFSSLMQRNLVSKFDLPQYYADNHITEAGKEFFETVMIGSVMNESNIRRLSKEGGKAIRQKLVRAIVPLIDNKDLEGYTITQELNRAVDMAIQVKTSKTIRSIDDLASQGSLVGETYDEVTVGLAKQLEGTQKAFAEFMTTMNGGLKIGASGQVDIFAGGAESKEDILNRFLNLKKSIWNILSFLRKAWGMLIKQPVEVLRDGKRVMEMRWTMQKSQKADPAPAQFAVALDFDGVINSYKSGWKGATETDEPVPGAAAGIRKLIDTGRTVAIYSTRANIPEGEQTIREYLRDMIGEAADTIHITDRKPIAAVYVDDRAIPFTGDWDETLDAIETFKPWIDHPPISNEIVPVPDGIYEGLRAAWEIRLDNGVSFPTTHGIKCSWNHPMLCKVNVISGVPYLLEKSLTWSGYKLQGRTKMHGMDISIENKKGSVRRGTDKDGHEWSTKMNYDYGYIRGTVGKDKDHLDCYLGPNLDSETVFVVHQNDPVTGEYDEDKVMLGFDSLEEARNAYLSQYDRPGFLGELDEMDIETFKEKAFDERNKGKKIGR